MSDFGTMPAGAAEARRALAEALDRSGFGVTAAGTNPPHVDADVQDSEPVMPWSGKPLVQMFPPTAPFAYPPSDTVLTLEETAAVFTQAARSHVSERNVDDDATDHDPVNSPSHYTAGGIETIDAIEAWGLDFHLGNVVKYVSRAGKKGDAAEDLQKAAWYLQRAIEREASS